ncbi:uncharacterized protein LOC124641035 [Helicoverpa zea]|uniref:uncharacterized protein LOC124641035 n=1 Tax=Helicoverpa zea TaxID=7113 RepID=UPI001F585D69|nr:uncharacterized protein LOC124641035 [Helicoverpa zea]
MTQRKIAHSCPNLTMSVGECSVDECFRFELQTALQYVRLRPFRYTLCRAVPLDINLLHYSDLFLGALLTLLHSKVMIYSPAVILEVTIREVEKIKAILTTQILRTSDECLRFELQTALQYVRLRPFRYTLCRAVPLDINLLFTSTAFCITYVIVALQVTHFAAY